MTSEKRLSLLCLAMAAAALGLLALPLALGQVYIKDDLGSFHLPTRFFYAGALARGEPFLWCPSLFGGFYLHGEGQAGLLHPLHWLLYRALPLSAAFNLELLSSYVAMLPGTYLFLRCWQLRRDAALFGAFAFTFSGFNMSHFVHPNMVAVFAHTPWLLLAQEVALHGGEKGRVRLARLGLGLPTLSQVLLGHPQALWLAGVVEACYFVLRAPSAPGRRWAVVEAKLLGVASGAVQLLPTWDVVSGSVRVDASAFRYRHALEPANLLQLVGPYLSASEVFGRYPQEFSLYQGAAVGVLAAWLLVRGRELAHWGLARAALALAAVSLLLALGERGYLYRLQAALPLVGLFESSARYIALVHFALAVAAAIAFADLAALADAGRPVPWRRLRPLALLPLASLAVAGAAFWLRRNPERLPELAAQLAAPPRLVAGPLLVLLATGLVLAAARASRPALAALVVTSAIDQAVYGLAPLREPFPPLALDRFVAGQAPPPEDSPQRVQSNNNVLSMRGARLAGGYAAFARRASLDPLDGVRLRVAGVRWVQTRVPWARGSETAPRLGDAVSPQERLSHDALGRASTWREVRDPLPRAWLVTRERVGADPGSELASIDPATTALVGEPLGLEEGRAGDVAVVSDRPGEVRLRAAAPTRQLLVLSEAWHPGWRVAIDGATSPARRVNGDFLGGVVGAGTHEVRFAFQPESFRVGAWLSALALSLLLAACWLRRVA